MPAGRAGDLATREVDGQVEHRDELAGPDLLDHDVVRGGEEGARLRIAARQRPEDELRHRHVRGSVDAVAGDIAEHDREPVVVDLEVVVDVSADADERRRLVDRADLEAGDPRPGAREQRKLHRVRERLLLLVETCVVDGEGRLRGDRPRGVERLVRDRAARVERDERHRRQHLSRRRDRHDRGGRTALQEGDEQAVGAAELGRRVEIEPDGPAFGEQPPNGARLYAFRRREDGVHRRLELPVGHVHRLRDE